MRALHGNTHVRTLILTWYNVAFASAAAVQALAHMLASNKSITRLSLDWTIPSQHVSLLASGLQKHPVLQKLELTRTALDVASSTALVSALLRCPSMDSLDLSDCEGVDANALAELTQNHVRLRWLSLRRCGTLHGRPLSRFLHALGSLSYLDLNSNWLDEEDARSIAHMLRQNRALRGLRIEYNNTMA